MSLGTLLEGSMMNMCQEVPMVFVLIVTAVQTQIVLVVIALVVVQVVTPVAHKVITVDVVQTVE